MPTAVSSCPWQANKSLFSFWFPHAPEQGGPHVPSGLGQNFATSPGYKWCLPASLQVLPSPPSYSLFYPLRTEPRLLAQHQVAFSLSHFTSSPSVSQTLFKVFTHSHVWTPLATMPRDKNAMPTSSGPGDMHSPVCWGARGMKGVTWLGWARSF